MIHRFALETTGTNLNDYTDILEQMGYSCWTLDGRPAKSAETLRECQLVAVYEGSTAPKWLGYDPQAPLGKWEELMG